MPTKSKNQTEDEAYREGINQAAIVAEKYRDALKNNYACSQLAVVAADECARRIRLLLNTTYHGLTYEKHQALKVQRDDGSWWCPDCEEAIREDQ